MSAPTDDAGRFVRALYGTDPATSQPVVDVRIEFGGPALPKVIERTPDPDVYPDGPWEDMELLGKLTDAISDQVEIPHTGWVPLRLVLAHGSGSWTVDAAIEGIDGPVNLRFADGSIHTFPFEFGDGDVREPLDVGARLLEPITTTELAGLEPVLAQLWSAIDGDALTETQQHQVLAMAELLKAQQLTAQPGVTERWKLVGSLRAALVYLRTGLPKDALAWWKLAELIYELGWSTLAGEIAP